MSRKDDLAEKYAQLGAGGKAGREQARAATKKAPAKKKTAKRKVSKAATSKKEELVQLPKPASKTHGVYLTDKDLAKIQQAMPLLFESGATRANASLVMRAALDALDLDSEAGRRRFLYSVVKVMTSDGRRKGD